MVFSTDHDTNHFNILGSCIACKPDTDLKISVLPFTESMLSLSTFNLHGNVMENECKYLPLSSSLKLFFKLAMMSSGGVKPVKEKEKPSPALDARLSAALLLTSSNSSFSCPLLDFLVWFPTLRPGEPILPKLDFLDSPPLVSATEIVSADAVRLSDCLIDAISICSDLVLRIPDEADSI